MSNSTTSSMANTPSEVESISDITTASSLANILFCGSDHSNEKNKAIFDNIGYFSKDRRFPVLATFLSRSEEVLKREIALLSHADQKQLPPFRDVLSLANYQSKSPLGHTSGAINSALHCILQLAVFIIYNENPSIKSIDSTELSILAGLSHGLLSAAAISVTTSWFDLANTGPESVRVAFRLGFHVEKASKNLEQTDVDGKLQSWAYLITDMSVAEVRKELDLLESNEVNSHLNRVFVSAADKNSVTVTGPPSQLKRVFLASQRLRYSRNTPLAIYDGICHAPSFYSTRDVDSIIYGSPKVSDPSGNVRIPLLSTNDGAPYRAETAGQLLEKVVAEILTSTIYLDNLSKGISDTISNSPICHLMHFGSSAVWKGLFSNIENTSTSVELNQEDITSCVTTKSGPQQPSSFSNAKLAIVGMSCRLPGGANNNELFWNLMMEGRDVHTRIPKDRFDLDTHFDPSGKTPNATQTPFGNFIDDPGKFDAGFFNMSPLEAEQTDPMHRLALVTAYEALEMAGYSPNRTPSTNPKNIGTFYGQAGDDWREVNAGQNHGTYSVPGGERAFANGRINYFFKFGGPSFNVDTACSSGLAAVQAACSSLWLGQSDMVIAGGLSIITNPDNYCALGKGHFLSLNGQCKVWDKSADGYCRADGIGSVVIKRLEDAEADNDNIIAVVSAGATNHSAESASITQPHAGAQIENYTKVLQAAGVDPLDVTFVELHGTGTQVGDAVESESVASVFSPLTPSMRRRADKPLHLGAIKSSIGHGEASAGVASLIKTLLVFQKNEIPPQVPFPTGINPVVEKNISRRNMGLVMKATPWPKPHDGSKRYALVNSFGAHGGNTTLLLEDPPEKVKVGNDTRSTLPFTISARSKASLKANIESMHQFLNKNPETNLADLSYTLCARRIHHSLRVAGTSGSIVDLQNMLKSWLETSNEVKSVTNGPGSVVLVFTGQGTFYHGIGTQLYHNFPHFREEIQALDGLSQKMGFPSILSLIENSQDEKSSVKRPLLTQLTILLVELALTQFWQLMGVTPAAVIGHSLGEYAALVAAGILSAADAIYLVGMRAQLVESKCELNSHAMISVREDVDTISKIVDSKYTYDVSCINGQKSTVISGPKTALNAIRIRLEAENIHTTQLEVPIAFHSQQLDCMIEEFEKIASFVTYKPPRIPILSPLLQDCLFDGKTVNARYLAQSSRQTVHFLGALEAATELELIDEKTIWLEIGPSSTCSSFIKSWAPSAKVLSSLSRSKDNFATIGNSIAELHCCGVPILWNEYYKFHEKSYSMINLESYKWNEKNYWIQLQGTWTLDKAFPTKTSKNSVPGADTNELSWSTSSIHQATLEMIDKSQTKLVAISNLKSPSLVTAVKGHKMNGYGVATTSIWADMALSIGEHIFRQTTKATGEIYMNISDMEVLHAQVISDDLSTAHLIKIEAELDLTTRKTFIRWYSLSSPEPTSSFAACIVVYEDSTMWAQEWAHMTHLVQGRVDELTRLAHIGIANSINRNMAYTLFKNVVDYADKYRGMHLVIMSDLEAVADVILDPETHGNWHSAPHYLDSVCHVGGLVMNGSDASNTKDYFYVTPGWGSFRMLHRLEPQTRYRSYARMFSTTEANMYAGDVYILQENRIVGMMKDMKFRRVPRLLMSRFFSPSDVVAKTGLTTSREITLEAKESKYVPDVLECKFEPHSESPYPAVGTSKECPNDYKQLETNIPAKEPDIAPSVNTFHNPLVTKALELISRESGQKLSSLTDEALFVELGIDSLMSLVLSEKFRTELNLEVNSTIFLQYDNVGQFKDWLEDYC